MIYGILAVVPRKCHKRFPSQISPQQSPPFSSHRLLRCAARNLSQKPFFRRKDVPRSNRTCFCLPRGGGTLGTRRRDDLCLSRCMPRVVRLVRAAMTIADANLDIPHSTPSGQPRPSTSRHSNGGTLAAIPITAALPTLARRLAAISAVIAASLCVVRITIGIGNNHRRCERDVPRIDPAGPSASKHVTAIMGSSQKSQPFIAAHLEPWHDGLAAISTPSYPQASVSCGGAITG